MDVWIPKCTTTELTVQEMKLAQVSNWRSPRLNLVLRCVLFDLHSV